MEQERDDQLQQIAERCKESTVCLKNKFIGLTMSGGSGFFVAPDKIVTNIHVIDGLPGFNIPGFNVKAITAKQFENERIPIYYRIPDIVKNRILRLSRNLFMDLKAKDNKKPNQSRNCEERMVYTIEGVTAFDDKNDLVLLKVIETGVPLPFGDIDVLESDEQVYIVGYDGTQYKTIAGTIPNKHNRNKEFQIKIKHPHTDVDGHSGGPVINSKGEVIGVVVSAEGQKQISLMEDVHSFVTVVPLTVLEALLANSGEVERIAVWRKRPQIRAYRKTDLGNLISEAGKYEKAIACYDTALRLNPNLANTYFKRGLAKRKLSDYEGAIEDYNNAIKLNPEYATAYYNRGNAKRKLSDHEGAIEDYNNVIKLNPEYVMAYNNRGNAKDALGAFEGAIEDHDTAIRLDPEHTAAYNNRGRAKKALGDTKSAITDYDMAIRLDPENASAYNNRGNGKKALGDYNGAIEDYNMAIKLNPEYALAYNNRGRAKKALGQQEAAEADFAKAMELDTD